MSTRAVAWRHAPIAAGLLALHPSSGIAQTTGDDRGDTPPIAEFRHHHGRPLTSGKPAIDVRMFGRHPDAANSLPLDQSPARGLRETLDRLASPRAGWNGPTRSWSPMPLGRLQQSSQRQRSWIGRHPVLFGTAVGFGAGFLIGYLPGDDGVFEDQNAAFSGWVLGGVGAGVGALVGALVR